MKLTNAQMALFFKAFAPAWQEHCRRTGADPDDKAAREDWRHAILFQEAGVTSLTAVRPGADLDKLLKRLAAEAGDYARAAHLEAAGADRIRARCDDCLRQIAEILGAVYTPADRDAYLARVTGRAYQGRAWLDIPERDLDRIFMMLDTHRRRLLRQAGWLGSRACPLQPLSFSHGRRYQRINGSVSLAKS